MIPLLWYSLDSQIQGDRKQRQKTAKGWGWEEIEIIILKGMEFQFEDMKKVLVIDGGNDCTTMEMYLM